MNTQHKITRISDIWLKASVVGSLWASVEIILGSFFHNLRIPFAGTILAMNGVALMVAFHQIWKEKGLFWRAGLICALMKSVSPSALLLGPMIGIFSEALIMEIFVRILGANLAGYIVGGALALTSTIAHKIVSLLILYGFDFVTILNNLYQFAVRQIGQPDLSPELALWFLFGIYFILGIFSVVFGYLPGKSAFTNLEPGKSISEFDLQSANNFFETDVTQTYSVKYLFLHIFAIASCFIIINMQPIGIPVIFILVYVLFCISQYRRSLKHLKKPFFWIQAIVLTLLATLFFNGFKSGNLFDYDGMMAGIKMNIRAILVVVGFSAISVELRNPFVKSVLLKRGFSQLYLSLGLAFSALPSIIRHFAKPGQFLKHPIKSLGYVLQHTQFLLELFRTLSSKPRVFIITGEKHAGKTTFLAGLVSSLKKEGIKTGGFIAPGKFENNRRSEFNIQNLKTGEQRLLCSIHLQNGEEAGPFRFNHEGQQFGKDALLPENLLDCSFVVIDEIGPLEIKGLGWAASIDKLMDHAEFQNIWVVRKSLVEEVIKKWKLHDVNVFDIRDYDTKKALKIIGLR